MKSYSELDAIVVNEFPHFLAYRFQLMLNAVSFHAKVEHSISFFEAGLRALTLGILSQYLYRDLDLIHAEDVRKQADLVMENKKASLGDWKKLFFALLEAYGGHRERFFMPQLYDFYWTTTKNVAAKRKGVARPFDRFVELRNEIRHPPPSTERGWKSFWIEIEPLLYEVIEHFAFFAEFALIYIVDKQGNDYVYEVHTGQTIRQERSALTGTPEVKGKWCYLAKRTGELLPIHPLIIQLAYQAHVEVTQSEIVLFEYYRKGTPPSIVYLTVDGRKPVQDQTALELFEWLLNQIRRQHQYEEVRNLTWTHLTNLSETIVKKRMIDARAKYDPNTYSQRRKVREQFDTFLNSDTTCLVLLGSSGVGKTNLVMSLIDEFSGNDTVCIFPLNGAHLSAEGQPLEALTTDFKLSIQIKGRPQLSGNDLMMALADIHDIDNRRVVIIIDSINENPNAKAMLPDINAFVETYSSFPWLKVVIVSRPEAWRTMRQDIPLATDHFFRLQGEQQIGIELSGFDYGLRLHPFEYTELPEAYEKYQKAYGLQTEYDDIPPAVKMMLRDPLALFLTASTYRRDGDYQGYLPEELHVSHLIPDYIAGLRKGNPPRLTKDDLPFLQDEIVPRLFAAPDYPTTLDPLSLIDEYTKKGEPLYNLIYDEYYVHGKRVNLSYRNLADSAILTEQTSDSDSPISFKYERFYEYFGGLHLSARAQKAHNKVGFYLGLRDVLPGKPYLWGAIKNAIVAELQNGNHSDFITLAQNTKLDDHLFRNTLVTAVAEYGEAQREEAIAIIRQLVQPCVGPAQDLPEVIRRFTRRKRFLGQPIQPGQLIALEAAGAVEDEETLVNAATDRFASLRESAALQIFHLWRRNEQVGYDILHAISAHAIAAWGLPDMSVLDTLTSLSISLLVYDYFDPEVQANVLRSSRKVLRELLLLNPEDKPTFVGRLRRAVAFRIRVPLLALAVNWGVRILSAWSGNQPANIKTLSHFFELSENERDFARRMIPYFDPELPGLVDEFENIVALEDTGDLLLWNYWQTAAIVRCQKNFPDALQLIQKMVDLSLKQPRPTYDTYAWVALQMGLRQNPVSPELYDVSERCALAVQADPREYIRAHREFVAVHYESFQLGVGLSGYVILHSLMFGPSRPALIDALVQKAVEKNDIKYLRGFIAEMAVVFELRYRGRSFHILTLECLKPLATVQNDEVLNEVAHLLARMRRYYPDDVENLLYQDIFPDSVKQSVLASPSLERLNDLLGIGSVAIFYDLFVFGPDILREELLWLATKAPDATSLRKFLEILIGEMLNLAANEEVFAVPADSPSARHFRGDITKQ